jgi:2-amino-4-hydroxy-6-hydroxymethyldihydropteridine diphosphokinase
MRTAIALGANIGDRLQNMRTAGEKILALPNIGEPVLKSRVYETEPVDSEPGAPWYLNAVIEVEYDGDPLPLLEQLREIEKQLGRTCRTPRNAPRVIDLDLLYIENLILETPGIQLPHPRLHLRRFVLAPLHDVRPDLMLPGQNKTVSQLLDMLPPSPKAELVPEQL